MFTYVDGLLKYKDASGQWHEADVIKGESAYQAAVRLGIFSGTESEYYNKITNDRDGALSQINAKLTEVLSAIDTKKQQALADIPDDYTTLSNDVSDLKSAFDVHVGEFETFANGFIGYVTITGYESNVGSHWNGSGALVSNDQTTMMTAVKISAIGIKSFALTGQQINYNSIYAIRWVKTDGTVVSSADYTTSDVVTDYVVTCPADAKYLLVTYKNNTGVTFAAKAYKVNTAVKTYIDNIDNSIKTDISLFSDQNYSSDYGWRNATITSTGGSESNPRNDRLCTDYLPFVTSVKCKNNYYGLISYYKADKTWIGITSFTKNFAITQDSFPAETAYVRIAMNNGTSSINTSEGVNCDIRFSSQGIAKNEKNISSTTAKADKLLKNEWIDKTRKTVKFMSREGLFHKEGTLDNLPYDCLVGIQNAHDFGYEMIRVDVRWTTDNVPVLQHDDAINSVAKQSTGDPIVGDVNISEHTLAELNVYDFGIRYGAEYAGMEITQLADALELCKQLGMECSLEIKPETVTTEQFNSMIDAIVKSSMAEHVYIRSHSHEFLTTVHTSAPGLNIEVSSSVTLTEANQLLDIDFAISMKSSFNNVRVGFAYTAGTTTFYDSVLKKAQMNGIDLIAASVYNSEDLIDIAVSKIPIIEVAFVREPYEVFYDSLNE